MRKFNIIADTTEGKIDFNFSQSGGDKKVFGRSIFVKNSSKRA